METERPPTERARAVLLTTGIAGITTVVSLFGAQALIQVGGSEPAFDAPAAEVHRFFAARNPDLFSAGAYLSVLGLVVFLWFLGGVYALLKGSEEERDWLSTIALISGVVFVASVITGGWELAAFRIDERLDPELARFAFDMGNVRFAASWVALGSFSLATGWAILSSPRALPRWLGWWAVVAGAGLVAARAVWTTPLWLFPYALFWLWVIATSVLYLRRRSVERRRGTLREAGTGLPDGTR